MDEATYILTADLDGDSFAWLDALRRQHFPPERNVLAAHLTLFHRLSGPQIERLSALTMPSQPIGLEFPSVRFLGTGVAFTVRSPGLERLRGEIAAAFQDELSRQDSQKWMPHVTVQNKAPPDLAREVFTTLQQTFNGRTGQATGLSIWEYLGGPWRLARRQPFRTA